MPGLPAILYRDDDLLVIDKPAGLAVHPGPRTPDSLEDRLDALRLGRRRRPTIMHRLDRDTAGCLALARTAEARRWLQQAFETRRVVKRYWALVAGLPDAAEGVIDAPLRKISSAETGWRMMVDPMGERAFTRWRLLAILVQDPAVSLVELTPETGRTHQLRVHCAALGWPIVGDPVYGAADGIYTRLFARQLILPLPDGGEADVRAAPPPHMAGWIPETL